MDSIDHQILEILQHKARIPNIEVARTIGMAPSAVLERIRKLEAKGIIHGYEVRLNPERFNCSMIAFIRIKVARPADIDAAGRALSLIDQVQEIHHIAGDDGLLVKIRADGHKDLENIITTRISAVDKITQIRSHIVLSTFKESAKIPLPPAAAAQEES